MTRTIIESCAVATVDDERREFPDGHVVLDGDRIAAVGPGAAPAEWRTPEARRIDGRGLLATPAFVNCHHHLYQSATRGYAQDATLFEWLVALYPVWGHIDAGTVDAAARAALAALARSGCATSTDHHYVFPRGGGDLLATEIEAARAIGLRFHPCRGAMDLGQRHGGLPPDHVVEDRDAILAACAEAIDRHHDPSPGARTRVALAPTSPFSVTRELMAETAELARARGVRLHTHLAETDDEEAFCLERYGVRPLQYLDDLGWLGEDVWLAHCVHLDGAETRRMGATGTGVAHCPTSNGRLGAGMAPVRELLDAGAPVGLGVDGAASNESGELTDDLRGALLVARLRGGPRGAEHPGGARARHPPRRPLPRLGRRARSPQPGCAGRRRPVAHRRRRARRDRRPGRGARPRPAPPGRDPAGGRRGGRGRRGADDGRPAHAGVRPGAGGGPAGGARGVSAPAVPQVRGGVGERLPRSDGRAKVRGAFAYASDLHADHLLHGVTVRSPHASARIRGLDTAAARRLPGVRAVLTHEDVPGAKLVGAGPFKDQPVLAIDRVRCHGEPVAVVAAEDLATARAAAALVAVDYAPLAPLTSVEAALAPGAPPLHPRGNEVRAVRILHGDADAPVPDGAVVVEGTYEVGIQDQAFLGPEAGLARPRPDGGVELDVATQWLHADREQVAAALGLPEALVHLRLAGVGGAFGGREDLSVHVHACLLALATGRPVKMSYRREESFVGHVHRHPARMTYRHVAGPDGRLHAVDARLVFDGGAYASSSTAVISNAATLACGPYAVPNARIEGVVAYTNNPPCGAMRGFGAPQVAIAYEAQMDRLADALGMDRLELRVRNALRTGDEMPTGQRLPGPAGAAALLEGLRALEDPPAPGPDPRSFPGGPFGAGTGEGLRRGVGYAYGFKNIAFSEGFDDFATARVRLEDGVATVHTAGTEVGQGLGGVLEQIARTELGVEEVRVLGADTQVGGSGSASASRLTWVLGGAAHAACGLVREARDAGEPEPIEREAVFRHPPTFPMDPVTGRGDVHAGFAFVAHRAVVDVDVELGLARVAQLACAQDVGRAVNPLALEGQLEGGSVQGLGLALMEELLVADGVVLNRSLGEYRIPTVADAPALPSVILELDHPDAPYGVTGVGEMASITSTAAVLAALRDATGRPLRRAPVRPEDLADLEGFGA